MTRIYGSFLIRWWRLGTDEHRIEIEHIQSGRRMRASSPAAALAWMNARSADSVAEQPGPPE